MDSRNYSVFDNMVEGIQIINNKWEYVYVNQAIIKDRKTSKKKILSSTFLEVNPEIKCTEMYELIEKCIKERVACKAEYMYLNLDGSKGWVELGVEPIDNSLLIMTYDVTKRNQLSNDRIHFDEILENKVRERTKVLRKSLQKETELNSRKSAFVSMASHEFRTPLTSILLSTNLLESYLHIGDNLNGQKHIKQIESGVWNLTHILDKFLSLDKLEQGKITVLAKPFDLKILLGNFINEFEGHLKSGQSIHLAYAGISEVVTDKKILRNVLVNLFSNAIKYSNDIIELDVKVSEKHLNISIKDKGVGIPEDQQKMIFEKFFRAKNVHDIQGSGLGLNIVKYYVMLLNGTINFKSTEGVGTTFNLDLANNWVDKEIICNE